MNKLLIYTSYFALLLSIEFLSSCTNEEAKGEEKFMSSAIVKLTDSQTKSLSTDSVKYLNEFEELLLTGEVNFNEDKVTKVFPLASGNVVLVNVSLGDYVHKGEVLAVLRSSELNNIQADYNVAKNNLQIAEKNLQIARELYSTKVNSTKDVLAAESEYKRANGEVQRLTKQFSIYRTNPNSGDASYNIVSPIDGYVVEKNINEEMEVRTDNASNVFTVSYLNTVWVMADVYESDMSKVHEGDSVSITTIAYPDRIFKGVITKLGNVLDPQSKVLKARIELQNKDGLLKPEMFAQVKVRNKLPKKQLAVKSSAVVFIDGKNYVVVRKGKNIFEKRNITVEHAATDITYIKSGIKEGECIITNGSLYVASTE